MTIEYHVPIAEQAEAGGKFKVKVQVTNEFEVEVTAASREAAVKAVEEDIELWNVGDTPDNFDTDDVLRGAVLEAS